jgi:hypothetical protein
MKEQRWKVVERKVIKRIFGSERQETRRWRKFI